MTTQQPSMPSIPSVSSLPSIPNEITGFNTLRDYIVPSVILVYISVIWILEHNVYLQANLYLIIVCVMFLSYIVALFFISPKQMYYTDYIIFSILATTIVSIYLYSIIYNSSDYASLISQFRNQYNKLQTQKTATKESFESNTNTNTNIIIPPNLPTDYSQPIKNYYWAASYRSYANTDDGFQSIDSIIQVLSLNYRFIHLNITGDTVIQPDMIATSQHLTLDDCIKTISQYAWKKPREGLPLILYLEYYNNDGKLKTLPQNHVDIFKKYFNGRFMGRKYSFNGRNGKNPVLNAPLSDSVGNVIIVTNNIYHELVNIMTAPINKNVMSNTISIINYTSQMEEHDFKSNFGNMTLINNQAKNGGILLMPDQKVIPTSVGDIQKTGIQFILVPVYEFVAKPQNLIAQYQSYFGTSPIVLKPPELQWMPPKPLPSTEPQLLDVNEQPTVFQQNKDDMHDELGDIQQRNTNNINAAVKEHKLDNPNPPPPMPPSN